MVLIDSVRFKRPDGYGPPPLVSIERQLNGLASILGAIHGHPETKKKSFVRCHSRPYPKIGDAWRTYDPPTSGIRSTTFAEQGRLRARLAPRLIREQVISNKREVPKGTLHKHDSPTIAHRHPVHRGTADRTTFLIIIPKS